MDVTKLVGIEVSSKDEAKQVYQAIENRVDEERLEVAEASLVFKNDKGHIKRHHYGTTGFGIGASIGGGVGLGTGIAATLGIINPFLGIGLLGGAAVGGFIGHFFTKNFVGKDFLQDIGEGLDNGRGYVLVATDDAGTQFIKSDSAAAGHKIAEIDITPEFVEDLQKATEEAQAAEGTE